MMTDLATRRSSLGKRPRSPSLPPSSIATALSSENPQNEHESRFHRLPKRLRKSQSRIDEDFDTSSKGPGNPLNRRNLKKERKRERKVARLAAKATNAADGEGGGMEIDDMGGGLGFTFMA